MTTCSAFAEAIRKRVNEGKNIDTIANELCQDVKFGRQKLIRTIKNFFGNDYLIENAPVLGYDTDKARLARMKKSQKNFDAQCDISRNEECCNTNKTELLAIIESIREIISVHGVKKVIQAFESIMIEMHQVGEDKNKKNQFDLDARIDESTNQTEGI